MMSKVTCSFSKRPTYNQWVSAGLLQLIEARQSTPGDRGFEYKRKLLLSEIVQPLRKDREAWWSERANELVAAAAFGNCRKLFQLIQVTGSKKSGVNETVCEDDGIPITKSTDTLNNGQSFLRGSLTGLLLRTPRSVCPSLHSL
ncbi:unnamed protein product [Schistosoma mattheei]|uniref:Uncharacterized protein n=1 Tax=Schistosoma mattheei TaxID=31246 RepID=A0AA85BPM6_9TREM|nr:unnamed protein product [Schistosoma mattheei]